MRNIIAIFVGFFIISYCNAQDNCNCEQAVKQLIQKVETEYPGFNDKTKGVESKYHFDSSKFNMHFRYSTKS